MMAPFAVHGSGCVCRIFPPVLSMPMCALHVAGWSEDVILLQLFASSQLESKEFFEMEDLANHMGLFLQKTNIIRDYLEDINEEPAPR